MPDSHDAVVLVLPRGCLDAVLRSPLNRWLCRGDVQRDAEPREPLDRVAAVLGLPDPRGAHGALRYWGQTGKRPADWIAAADPVFLEPRLDHLRLHHIDPGDARADTPELFEELAKRLATDDSLAFAQIDGRGYLRAGGDGFATAGVSAEALDGEEPSRHIPADRRLQALVSEIEMALYQSTVQDRRASAGRRPVSGLWLWGGGRAPAARSLPLPTLFADDPLARGYWHAAAAGAGRWPGSLSDCLADEGRAVGFIPASAGREGALSILDDARKYVARGEIRRLILIFADSLTVGLTRAKQLRFWRRPDALPSAEGRSA